MTKQEEQWMDEIYDEKKADGSLDREEVETQDRLAVAHHNDNIMNRVDDFDPYHNRVAFCMFLDDIKEHIDCLDLIKAYPNSGRIDGDSINFDDTVRDNYLTTRINNYSYALDPYGYNDVYESQSEGFDTIKSWLYDKELMQQLFDASKEMYEDIYDKSYTPFDYPRSCGGNEHYKMFYTGPGYPEVTESVIKDYGLAVGMKHHYWATESSCYAGMYNGDTYVLYDDINNLPESFQQDAMLALSQARNLPRHVAEQENIKDKDIDIVKQADVAADYQVDGY